RTHEGREREGARLAARSGRNRSDAKGARLERAGLRCPGGCTRRVAAGGRAPATGARGPGGGCGGARAGRARGVRGGPARAGRGLRGDAGESRLAATVRELKQKLAASPQEVATRRASEIALESLVPALPELLGGSADLTGSNNTRPKGMAALSASDYAGRFVH